MGVLFGTDGVRGVANEELQPELAFRLGKCLASILRQRSSRPKVVVGKDTRISGDMLEAAMLSGICSAGADAIRVGVMSTPGVAYVTRALRAEAGVVISASHNPVEYNGIKFFSRDGYKLPDETEAVIEELVLSGEEVPRCTGSGIGRVQEATDARSRYIDYVRTTVPVDLRGWKIALDCAHGAAYVIAPEVLRGLGADVAVVNAAPDGMNINVGCGSTYPDALKRAMAESGAMLGFAHDGDADRVIAVDERGEVVDGDQILALCGLHLLREGKLPRRTVAATVMSNLGLEIAMKRAGGHVLRTPVGDRYVLDGILRHGLNLGGEQSGHIIFLDHNTTGDGIITALQVMSVMTQTGKSLSELAGQMRKLPQILVNVPVKRKELLEESEPVNRAIEAATGRLGESGRVLVRASGTEPLVRVMVEAAEPELAESVAASLAEVVRRELGGGEVRGEDSRSTS